MKMGSCIPTPPLEDNDSHMKNSTNTSPTMHQAVPRRCSNSTSSSKTFKPTPRGTKRSASQMSHSSVPDHAPPLSPAVVDNRHKRVWKACERCRMKKTKCDGEFPCKRCKDDGLVCTAGTRKKTEYKQIPRGYAEVLENTQFVLVATVHKLYHMVRNGQTWDLGEPDLNERGQPIIHNIAMKLGCIRPNADADLPAHTIFPEDETDLAKLSAELEEVQQQQQQQQQLKSNDNPRGGSGVQTEEGKETRIKCEQVDMSCGSSEIDHSDLECDYRTSLLMNPAPQQQSGGNTNLHALSPQSFTSYTDFDQPPLMQGLELNSPTHQFTVRSPTGPNAWPAWPALIRTPPLTQIAPQFIGQMDVNLAEALLSQGLVESEFGTIKPHTINIPNPEVIVGVGDPMIAYSNYSMMDPLAVE